MPYSDFQLLKLVSIIVKDNDSTKRESQKAQALTEFLVQQIAYFFNSTSKAEIDEAIDLLFANTEKNQWEHLFQPRHVRVFTVIAALIPHVPEHRHRDLKALIPKWLSITYAYVSNKTHERLLEAAIPFLATDVSDFLWHQTPHFCTSPISYSFVFYKTLVLLYTHEQLSSSDKQMIIKTLDKWFASPHYDNSHFLLINHMHDKTLLSNFMGYVISGLTLGVIEARQITYGALAHMLQYCEITKEQAKAILGPIKALLEEESPTHIEGCCEVLSALIVSKYTSDSEINALLRKIASLYKVFLRMRLEYRERLHQRIKRQERLHPPPCPRLEDTTALHKVMLAVMCSAHGFSNSKGMLCREFIADKMDKLLYLLANLINSKNTGEQTQQDILQKLLFYVHCLGSLTIPQKKKTVLEIKNQLHSSLENLYMKETSELKKLKDDLHDYFYAIAELFTLSILPEDQQIYIVKWVLSNFTLNQSVSHEILIHALNDPAGYIDDALKQEIITEVIALLAQVDANDKNTLQQRLELYEILLLASAKIAERAIVVAQPKTQRKECEPLNSQVANILIDGIVPQSINHHYSFDYDLRSADKALELLKTYTFVISADQLGNMASLLISNIDNNNRYDGAMQRLCDGLNVLIPLLSDEEIQSCIEMLEKTNAIEFSIYVQITLFLYRRRRDEYVAKVAQLKDGVVFSAEKIDVIIEQLTSSYVPLGKVAHDVFYHMMSHCSISEEQIRKAVSIINHALRSEKPDHVEQVCHIISFPAVYEHIEPEVIHELAKNLIRLFKNTQRAQQISPYPLGNEREQVIALRDTITTLLRYSQLQQQTWEFVCSEFSSYEVFELHVIAALACSVHAKVNYKRRVIDELCHKTKEADSESMAYSALFLLVEFEKTPHKLKEKALEKLIDNSLLGWHSLEALARIMKLKELSSFSLMHKIIDKLETFFNEAKDWVNILLKIRTGQLLLLAISKVDAQQKQNILTPKKRVRLISKITDQLITCINDLDNKPFNNIKHVTDAITALLKEHNHMIPPIALHHLTCAAIDCFLKIKRGESGVVVCQFIEILCPLLIEAYHVESCIEQLRKPSCNPYMHTRKEALREKFKRRLKEIRPSVAQVAGNPHILTGSYRRSPTTRTGEGRTPPRDHKKTCIMQ